MAPTSGPLVSIASWISISRHNCVRKPPAPAMPRCDPTSCSNCRAIYGNPGSVGTLEDAFNKLTTAVQALSTSADSQSARIGVVNAANVLASQLNSMTQGIQTLRGAAENGINDSVNERQQPDVADRDHQQPTDSQSARRHLDRRIDGGAARPARSVHHAIVRTDGHSRHRQRRQPGYGLHHLRRASSSATRPPGFRSMRRERSLPTRSGIPTRRRASSARSSSHTTMADQSI